MLCLFVPGFQRQFFKHDKILSEQLKNERTREEQRERHGSGIHRSSQEPIDCLDPTRTAPDHSKTPKEK